MSEGVVGDKVYLTIGLALFFSFLAVFFIVTGLLGVWK